MKTKIEAEVLNLVMYKLLIQLYLSVRMNALTSATKGARDIKITI